MMQRLLMIAPSLAATAENRQMVWLATRLPANRFTIHICTQSGGELLEDLQRANITSSVIGWRGGWDYGAFRRLKRKIWDYSPDIVHCWGLRGTACERWGVQRAGVRRLIISTNYQDRPQNLSLALFERLLQKGTQRVVVNNEWLRQDWLRRGMSAKKIVVIPPGIRHEPQEPIPRPYLLKELNLPANARLAASVGPLQSNQRLKDLAWATELIEANHPEFHFLIFGEGPYRWRIARYVRQIHHAVRIHLMGEQKNWGRVLPHLDCFWYGGQANGIPMEMLEAMAAGVPVVAADVAGPQDVIKNRENGYLVPLGDRAEFARRTTVLMEDPVTWRMVSMAGQQRALEKFSLEHWVQRYQELYSALD